MEQLTVKNLTFSYEKDSQFSLKNISFSVEKGEILLIIGPSGCGKTTLLRHFKEEYTPIEKECKEGEIYFCERPLSELSDRGRAAKIGFVRQNVEGCQATDKVWHELAFGLESLGYSQALMQRKVAEMVAFFGLEDIYEMPLAKLSGGQKQIVNLASVMVMEPEVLILDEPTSQLDPVAASDFFEIITRINRELGTTILMTEHRLEEAFSLADKVMVMENGRVSHFGTSRNVARYLYEINAGNIVKDTVENDTLEKDNEALTKNSFGEAVMYQALPTASRLFLETEYAHTGNETETNKILQGISEEDIPITVREGRSWLESRLNHLDKQEEVKHKETKCKEKKQINKLGDSVLQAKELYFRYDRDGKDILKACSLNLQKGKITAVLGGNGAGKSTLLQVLAGHQMQYSGKIKKLTQSIGILPQNPQAMFARKTVKEELNNPEIIRFCGLEHVLSQHPFDLSGGEMQKLALGILLQENNEILLLDEPGKGLDFAFKAEMGHLLKQLAKQGKTILLVSHDVEFCAEFADYCGLFFDGHIVSMEDTKTFFLQNVFYTTTVARMCRGCLENAVTKRDVDRALGNESQVVLKNPLLKINNSIDNKTTTLEPIVQESIDKKYLEKEPIKKESIEEKSIEKKTEKKRHSRKRKSLVIPFIIFFLVMPLTIYFGETVLQQRKYYFISILLLLEAVGSFFLSFEHRKPKIREIMIVAMMTALVVVSRAAFYMVPNVKPMAALIIITGVGLGGEIGFLTGAMAMLVSNIFFGQGPWTPWQMFAMGLLGFVAGVIFKQYTECSKKKKYAISIFGFFAVMLIYGGVMNPASVIMYQDNVNISMIIAAYGMGIPFDLIHAAATFVFLLIGTRPMLNKLERINKKYGFY